MERQAQTETWHQQAAGFEALRRAAGAAQEEAEGTWEASDAEARAAAAQASLNQPTDAGAVAGWIEAFFTAARAARGQAA